MDFKKYYWKILAIVLILYTIIAGLLGEVPHLPILNESIRNFYFHVPMWFGMIILFAVGLYNSIKFLSTNELRYDIKAIEFVNSGILFGILGLTTGMVWAKYTWGAWWSNDPKQSGSAIALLIYLAYLVLRNSITDEYMKAKVAAVYNIFAFAVMFPLIFILPRLTDSLHPGSGGNPGFVSYDLDYRMRMIFYPAVIGWTLFGVWFAQLRIRLKNIELELEENNEESD